ncbi:MAG: hypothetical protein ORO03_07050 [Alphaproteobacteria bacterium]|nr:hypothetical protein [Alphaproteobacteria bacterium]
MVGRANNYQIANDSAPLTREQSPRFASLLLHPRGASASLAGIDCIVLAASLGALGEPVKGGTEEHQTLRSMLRTHGYLQFIIDRLAQSGARRILVCVGSPTPGRAGLAPRALDSDSIVAIHPSPASVRVLKQESGETPGVVVEWLVDRQAVGAAGLLRLALPYCRSRPVLVLQGDRLVAIDFGAMLVGHRRAGGGVSMLVSPLRQNREVALGLERVTVSPNRRVAAIQLMDEELLAAPEPDLPVNGETRFYLSSGAYLFDNRALAAAAASASNSLEHDYLINLPQGSIQAMIQDQPIFRSQKTPRTNPDR